jgi:hypothetical protein
MLLSVGFSLLLKVIFMVPICYMRWGTDLSLLALANIAVAVAIMIPLNYLLGFHCKLHYYGVSTYQYNRAKANKGESSIVRRVTTAKSQNIYAPKSILSLLFRPTKNHIERVLPIELARSDILDTKNGPES